MFFQHLITPTKLTSGGVNTTANWPPTTRRSASEKAKIASFGKTTEIIPETTHSTYTVVTPVLHPNKPTDLKILSLCIIFATPALAYLIIYIVRRFYCKWRVQPSSPKMIYYEGE